MILQEWSEPKSKIEEELHKKDAGITFCRNNGLLELYVHAKNAEEAFGLLVDIIGSQFIDHVYSVLVSRFPEIEESVDQMAAVNLQKMEEVKKTNDNPLVSPIIPKDVK